MHLSLAFLKLLIAEVTPAIRNVFYLWHILL